ncbi:MAG TPA: EthD family reductase [Bacteroidota bacterium]|nr:EthD family reductase [Bacteroidota bacterium]
MVKIIALYRNPSDAETFDKHYFDIHIPLVKKVPGLRKVEVTRITGAPIGESKFHLMAEMYFDSVDAMNAGNASPEGKAVARDVMSFAADVLTLFYGEVQG